MFPNFLRTVLLSLTCLLASGWLSLCVAAESQRDYSITRTKTEELKGVATQLRTEFTGQLRRSDAYGPLLVRTVWLKSYARKINRRSRFQFDCDWRSDIVDIHDAICQIEALMGQVQLRAAYGLEPPLEPAGLNCIYQLIGRGKTIVYELWIDGGFAQPEFTQPGFGQPMYPVNPTPSLPAPNYLPESIVPQENIPTPAAEPTDSELIAPGPPLTLGPKSNSIRQSISNTAMIPTPTGDNRLTVGRMPWSKSDRLASPTFPTPRSSSPPVYWNGPFRVVRPTENSYRLGN